MPYKTAIRVDRSYLLRDTFPSRIAVSRSAVSGGHKRRQLTGGLVAEEAAEKSPVVVLGFDAAWGYAPADQTSPALAGRAGALIDTTMTGARGTALRIHGGSGSHAP